MIFAAIPSLIALLILGAGSYRLKPLTTSKQKGRVLNELGWNASYAERGLPVPPNGPRDGYWNERLDTKVGHMGAGWREPEQSVPGLFEVDAHGMQHWRSATEPTKSVLIVGGSVAWGVGASSIDKTYFAVMGRALEERGLPIELTVFASRAWKAMQEAGAVELNAPGYDLVVVISGINDMMLGEAADLTFGESGTRTMNTEDDNLLRATRFMEYVGIMADHCSKGHASLLVVLQPALAERSNCTPLERQFLAAVAKAYPFANVSGGFRVLRSGLPHVLESRGGHFFDASRIFDSETATTFCDWCHFSDPGHAILGKALAIEVAKVLGTD